MNDQGAILMIWMVAAAIGAFMMLALYSLVEYLVKHAWFKRLGPAVYYLITGDATALPNRKGVL